jgi:hypothetical protein
MRLAKESKTHRCVNRSNYSGGLGFGTFIYQIKTKICIKSKGHGDRPNVGNVGAVLQVRLVDLCPIPKLAPPLLYFLGGGVLIL